MPSSDTYFTPERAAEMARKSALVRQQNKERKPEQAKAVVLTVMESALTEDERMELELVEEQIACARKALNDETPWCPACERPELQPHHRAQLMKAMDSFLDRKRIILGRPLPGSLRPKADKPRRSTGAIEPEA